MKHSLAIFLSSLFLCPFLNAEAWGDPSWDEMVSKAEIVGRFEVVEAVNLHLAKAKPIKLLKGKMPEGQETITVTGYNDPYYSLEDSEAASLKKGDQVYFCLWKWEDEVEAAFHYFAPSPSCATFRISKEGKTNYSARRTSYPWESAEQSTESLEELLTAVIGRQNKIATDPKVIEKTLVAMRGELDKPADSSQLANYLARLHLMGHSTFQPEFEAISKSSIPASRFELAKLLGLSSKTDSSRKLLLVLFEDKDPIVQAETVRQLNQSPDEETAALFTKKLASAPPIEIAPEGAERTPEQHARLASRLTMIKTLSELKHKPAITLLATILKDTNSARELYFITSALQQMEATDQLIEPLSYHLTKNTSSLVCRTVSDVALRLNLVKLKPAFETYISKHGTTADELSLAAKAVGIFGDRKSGEIVEKRLASLLDAGVYNPNTQGMAFSLVDALGNLKYKPAKNLVNDTLFLFYGIDPVLVANPKLVKLKRDTELAVCKKGIVTLIDQPSPKVRATSFIMNRRAIESDPKTQPEMFTVLHAQVFQEGIVNISQGEVDSLKSDLAQITKLPPANVSVTSWKGQESIQTEGGDSRASAEPTQFALSAWLNYIEKTGAKENLNFLDYLLSSGIAERASVAGKANELFKTFSPKESETPSAK